MSKCRSHHSHTPTITPLILPTLKICTHPVMSMIRLGRPTAGLTSGEFYIHSIYLYLLTSNCLHLVFQSPVATGGKNQQPNWTTTNLDWTVVADPRDCVILSVAVALAWANIRNQSQPVTTGLSHNWLKLSNRVNKYSMYCTNQTMYNYYYYMQVG